MINFYLPDFYYKYDLNIAIIKILKMHPEYFYDNINITSIYGSFPGAIWNGGRLTPGNTDYNNIKATIAGFNELDVKVRFTFTNCLLEEKHIFDTYCNQIVSLADNGMNEIIVNSEILERYLRETYPNFNYIASTTKCERDINKINEMCNQYDLVVTDYRDNNLDFLSQIQQKEKIELLINAYCYPNCARRENHYKLLSGAQLEYKKAAGLNCDAMYNSFLDILDYPTVIKADDLYSNYVTVGFNNFKIEGRTLHNIDIIESYIYYLIKPEYKDKVRHNLVRQLWK